MEGPNPENNTNQMPQMIAYTQEEIEKAHPDGYYDQDGFFILPGKDFYDTCGYYFDYEGFDQNGGHYDESGVYVPPPNANDIEKDEEWEEYAEYYDELYGSEADDDEQGPGEEDEDNEAADDDCNWEADTDEDRQLALKAERIEHCVPVINWLIS